MNIKSSTLANKTGDLLRKLGQPTRVEILLTIGEGEVCVCHLESVLGQHQAKISQHLMVLRKAGVLETHRDGRFIFYRLRNPAALDLIRHAAIMAGVPESELKLTTQTKTNLKCPCPHCMEDANP